MSLPPHGPIRTSGRVEDPGGGTVSRAFTDQANDVSTILSGVRVDDLTSNVAAPSGSSVLAELEVEDVHVGGPRGDGGFWAVMQLSRRNMGSAFRIVAWGALRMGRQVGLLAHRVPTFGTVLRDRNDPPDIEGPLHVRRHFTRDRSTLGPPWQPGSSSARSPNCAWGS